MGQETAMNRGTADGAAAGIDLSKKRRWLVTGAAGFIGSHLVEALLSAGQEVAGLDNLSAGFRSNLDEAVRNGGSGRFRFFEGDIRDKEACAEACAGADIVLHHAAYVSVPGSVADPERTHSVNVEGFFSVLQAARAGGAGRFVYASSSAVYGDDPTLPKVEERRGRPLSPYAATKLVNELYAEAWGEIYGMGCIGLRYFNVFGPRQDPNGPYAAVIPRWIHAMRQGKPVTIFGDGETSRDFCCVKNVVRANLLAATTERREAVGQVYNIACGVKTTLNELYAALKRQFPSKNDVPPVREDFRKGDVAHSLASIERARALLGYVPLCSLEEGLREMLLR
jgi:UDP-N-acetylglucosamine 4-epimerase